MKMKNTELHEDIKNKKESGIEEVLFVEDSSTIYEVDQQCIRKNRQENTKDFPVK